MKVPVKNFPLDSIAKRVSTENLNQNYDSRGGDDDCALHTRL